MRTVDFGRYEVRQPWPEGTRLSGGASGIVLRRGGGQPYRTAFFESYPAGTFIRGEGATISEAEDAAWSQYERHLSCPGHEYETRGYNNGAGFCRHCGRFASNVFHVSEVGMPCAVCGQRTNWTTVSGRWFCQAHTPSHAERRRMRDQARAVGRTSGDSPLGELLDVLLGEDEPGS